MVVALNNYICLENSSILTDTYDYADNVFAISAQRFCYQDRRLVDFNITLTV